MVAAGVGAMTEGEVGVRIGTEARKGPSEVGCAKTKVYSGSKQGPGRHCVADIVQLSMMVSLAEVWCTSLYLLICDPADFANLPVLSCVDCLPPAFALQTRAG